MRDCQPLISRICKRISIWTSKFIGQAGRLQLINSILFAIQSFWARCVFLPNNAIKAIQSILARYLWAGNLISRCVFKVAWADCCYPKEEGGIGIKSIKVWSNAAILFQLWRIINKEESLWIEWLYRHDLKKKGFWSLSTPYKCSWSWRRILNSRDLAKQFIRYSPGCNSAFLFWHDPWLYNFTVRSKYDDLILTALEIDSVTRLSCVQDNNHWYFGDGNHSLVRDLRQECSTILITG